MKRILFNRWLPLTICVLMSCAIVVAQTNDNGPLTNAAIVKLVKAGFKEKSLLSIIASRPSQFELSPDRMIELKRNGVSEKVILAMIAHQEGSAFDDENWGDESFFNSGNSPSMSNQGQAQGQTPRSSNPQDGSTVDIFGTSGSSRGQQKTRNSSGESSGDVVTTGSATVKILRPPTEAGGAGPAKLEKTPSLTNDSVIELVEAGFSEGTIIRRIEQSPVNFDFAPEKIADLKKHRVSDKIVVAMKSAMGVDTGSTSTPTSNATPKQ